MSARLSRLTTALVVATAVSALCSVVTATLAFVSHVEARALRTELDAKWAAITKPLTHMTDAQREQWFRETEPEGGTSWDALPATEPLSVTRDDVAAFLFAGPPVDETLGARVVPAFESGQTMGFKVFSVAADSAYTRLGLKSGDIVRSVNGHDLKNRRVAAAAHATLIDNKPFRVDVKRGGKPVRIDYVIGGVNSKVSP